MTATKSGTPRGTGSTAPRTGEWLARVPELGSGSENASESILAGFGGGAA